MQSQKLDNLVVFFKQMSAADQQMIFDLARTCAEEEMAKRPRLRLVTSSDPSRDVSFLSA